MYQVGVQYKLQLGLTRPFHINTGLNGCKCTSAALILKPENHPKHNTYNNTSFTCTSRACVGFFLFYRPLPTSQKYASIWNGCVFGSVNVYACCFTTNWLSIQGVFLPHPQCSYDRFKIHWHFAPDKVITEDQQINVRILNGNTLMFSKHHVIVKSATKHLTHTWSIGWPKNWDDRQITISPLMSVKHRGWCILNSIAWL